MYVSGNIIGEALVAAVKGNYIHIALLLVEYKPDIHSLNRALHDAHRNVDIIEVLLRAGASLNESAVLVPACKEGNIEMVQLLLSRGANPNDVDHQYGYGRAALCAAADGGHIHIVEVLLAGNSHSQSVSHDRVCKALIAAAGAGHTDIVKLLFTRNSDGEKFSSDILCQALRAAAVGGHVEIARTLTDLGLDVAALNVALYDSHRNIGMVELLLGCGASVDNSAVLVSACEEGDTEMVRFLLARGADLNVIDRRGNTALGAATAAGHVLIVKLLLAGGGHGAPIPRDSIDKAFSIAACCGHVDIVEFLLAGSRELIHRVEIVEAFLHAACHGNIDMVKLLLVGYEQGEPMPRVRIDDALVGAVSANHIDTARFLIEQGGPDIGVLNRALCAAHKVDMAELLMKAGASINDSAVLVSACKTGNMELVQRLLSLGADVNVVDASDKSALSAALDVPTTDILIALLRHGADPNQHFINGNTPLLEVLPWSKEQYNPSPSADAFQRLAAEGRATMIYSARPRSNTLDMINVLLQHQADPNLAYARATPYMGWTERGAEHRVGRTPLMAAADHCMFDHITLLLEYGADVNQTNRAGQTVLHLMQQYIEEGNDDDDRVVLNVANVLDQEGNPLNVLEIQPVPSPYSKVIELCMRFREAGKPLMK